MFELWHLILVAIVSGVTTMVIMAIMISGSDRDNIKMNCLECDDIYELRDALKKKNKEILKLDADKAEMTITIRNLKKTLVEICKKYGIVIAGFRIDKEA